jgi:pSer/pThr/pTyr-binding forkhead associated (FHA) protein/tRNA A-37 threonylcarbamoyl transferase component Bud32
MTGDQLRVTEGSERGRRLSVDGELLIGREAPEDEGRFGDDPEISRRHARLSCNAEGRLEIEDLGSANGTFVNGERIDAPRTLDPGDVVRVGETVMEVLDRPRPAEELVVTAGMEPGRRLRLGDELVIGRDVDGEGRLSQDPRLSRRHARIVRGDGGRVVIEDLGSANGTFVNGERVEGRRALTAGDSVLVGTTTLELKGAGRVAAPPKRPPTTPDAAVDREALAAQVPPGSVFARCRVDEVIGHGDMGVVYRAEELALQRPVALKLILPQHSRDERFRRRFRREAEVAAAIDHPNVIPVFDAGDEGGVLYITMRLVRGTDLRALIDAEGRVEPLRAARIIRQVGSALDAAHSRGMLHRDVKPSNVLLGREDHVYLSDFGLAKPVASVDELTRHGTIVARAGYVAPEQIRNERVDARVDIYALGCVLFEALTGETPFARWEGGPEALAHVDAPRPSPSDVCPDVPRAFDDVVRRAMATDPGERYPSAGDLGQAALVAAGELRRARPESVVATGAAAFSADEPTAESVASAPQEPQAAPAGRPDRLRWAVALVALAVAFVAMIAELQGISGL